MLNRVILIGRLTRDPEMRYTSNGIAVTKFTLAIDRPFTNQAGERDTDFIDIVTWRKLAENCADHLVKGLMTAVEGRLQVRTFEIQTGENQGQKRKVSEVVADNVRFLEWPDKRKGADSTGPKRETDDDLASLEDDVPF